MKTPEEIKKGLKLHMGNTNCDGVCPYDGYDRREGSCITRLMKDTIAIIERLESENADLKSQLAQVERERDAAMHDLADSQKCSCCKYGDNFQNCREKNCYSCDKECPCAWCCKAGDGFKWRGVCEENTKEDEQSV